MASKWRPLLGFAEVSIHGCGAAYSFRCVSSRGGSCWVLARLAPRMVLGALHQWIGCPLWLVSAVAAEIVLLGRFFSRDRFVFGYPRPSSGRCWRFHVAAAGSFAVSWLVLNGAAVLLDVHYVVAAFMGSVASFVWSGLTNFLWVWQLTS